MGIKVKPKDDGGPIFRIPRIHGGISLRDAIAIITEIKLLDRNSVNLQIGNLASAAIADSAYRLADAMIARRGVSQEEPAKDESEKCSCCMKVIVGEPYYRPADWKGPLCRECATQSDEETRKGEHD